MTARKSTGKRVRFEVFKRDGFTCQYCGAQPPDVVLVVDHIEPVALGGLTEAINLITACEPCNHGKAHKRLGDVHPRPDADLLFLETQQEIAELRRFNAAVTEREGVLAEAIDRLSDIWLSITDGDWRPANHILRSLIGKYGAEIAYEAITNVATKMRDGYLQRNSHWTAYLFAVARNMAKDPDADDKVVEL